MNLKNVISVLAIATAGMAASCNTSADRQKQAAMDAQQNTIDSMKMELARQQVVDSMNEVAKLNYVVPQTIPVAEEPAVKHTTTRRSSGSTRRRSSSSHRSSSSSAPVYTSNTSNYPVASQPAPVYQDPVPAPAPQKKGWSAKAKGAVIGAATGAAGGAIINKRDRVKGAVIGGVLGAGAGVGVGAVIDKKNGR